MTKGYWVARVTVTDEEGYRNYVAANAVPFAKYGAKFLVRGGEFDQVEGTTRERNVIIEFPSLSAARDCYHSPEYQAAKALREGASEGDITIIAGYNGPQPGD